MGKRRIEISYRQGNQWVFACYTSAATCREARKHWADIHTCGDVSGVRARRVAGVPGWKYHGDMNPECGGFWWKPDEWGHTDFVFAVEVVPLSALGGPRCAFIVNKGTIYIGDKREMIAEFHKVVGFNPKGKSTDEIMAATVSGAYAYRGIGRDYSEVVQIGKLSLHDPEYPHGFNGPDTVLRGNSSLARYIRREFLR